MYSRYGLTTNPFISETALDVPPDSLTHFFTVDGFGEQKAEIDQLATEELAQLSAVSGNGDQEAKPKRNQFFLIHGNKGTGRTSVSNYIGLMFAGKEALKVVEAINDSGHERNLYNWMENFSLKAEDEGFSEVPAQFARVGDFSSVTLAKYVRFLRQALNELKAKNRRAIAVFEEVRNAELFPLVQDVFDPLNIALREPPLVIFTTSDAEISGAFANLPRRPKGLGRINLRETSGADILQFLSRRWELTSQFQPHPFDENTIVKAFQMQRYPLKRAVEALHHILKEKAESVANGGNWPDDTSLAIRGEEIALSLLHFESS